MGGKGTQWQVTVTEVSLFDDRKRRGIDDVIATRLKIILIRLDEIDDATRLVSIHILIAIRIKYR